MTVDVHQHLWPPAFLAALRARRRPPRLDGWTLELEGGDTYAIDPAAHACKNGDGALSCICVAPSAALGMDRLPADEALELAEAWLEGALALPEPYRAWATGRDPDHLREALHRGAIGLEIAAEALLDLDAIEPLLQALGDRPLLVHPGMAPADDRPGWWAPVVPYVSQLHAAWWAWADGGRERFPDLPVCFVALAGLGPLHGERYRARGGAPAPVDPLTFVETSSYGTTAIDAVMRVLGIDVICFGSDRPYAEPARLQLDPSALHAIHSANPARLFAQEVLA